jgi:cell division protein FtsB
MAPRGRFWVFLWLLFVLATLAWVVARQTAAVVAATQLDSLRNERASLEARQAELLRRIRQAESRAVLIPRAEALGLRLADDSETVYIEPLEEDR